MIIANAFVRFLHPAEPVKGLDKGTGTPVAFWDTLAMIEPTSVQPLAARQAGELVQARWTCWVETPAPGVRLPEPGDMVKVERVLYRNDPLRVYEGRVFRVVDVDFQPLNIRLALQEMT